MKVYRTSNTYKGKLSKTNAGQASKIRRLVGVAQGVFVVKSIVVKFDIRREIDRYPKIVVKSTHDSNNNKL